MAIGRVIVIIPSSNDEDNPLQHICDQAHVHLIYECSNGIEKKAIRIIVQFTVARET